MRKFFIILASLAVAGCMVSEISEETVYVNVDYPTYTATFDDEGTKVYVDTDLKMHWNAGDEISIFKTTGNQRYSFDGADGDREGTFSVQGDPQGGSELQTAYAVYPYSDNTSINTDGVITLNLPEVQHYAENSFGLGANTMVAVTESKDSDKLYFKNLCGYLVVKLYGEGTIKSITLTGNNGEKLSGQATVAPVYGEAPVLTMSESAGTSITLDCGEGVALGSTAENATAFWFAVPPVTFTQGFTVTGIGSSGFLTKSTSSNRRLVRNEIKSMAPIDLNSFESMVPPDNEIWYTTFSGETASFDESCFYNSILSNSFSNGRGVLLFSGTVTHIGSYAFKDKGICGLVFPDSVEIIDDFGLSGVSIDTFYIPENLKQVGWEGLKTQDEWRGHCIKKYYGNHIDSDGYSVIIGGTLFSFVESGVSHYTIPTDVVELSDWAFICNNDIETIVFPEGLRIIGDQSFEGCSNLKGYIYFPNSLEVIGPYAFKEDYGITGFYGNSRFCTDDHLCFISDYSGKKWINAFAGQDVEHYTIPSYISGIQNYGMSGGSNLRALTFSSKLDYFSSYSIYNCNKLEYFYGEGTTSDHRALCSDGELLVIVPNCPKEYITPLEVTSIGLEAFAIHNNLESIIISDPVTSLGSYAFVNCPNLKRIVLSSNLRIVEGWNPFMSCPNLEEIYFRSYIPPTYSDRQFNESDYTHLTVFVPEETLEMYKKSDWYQFAPYMVGYHYDDIGEWNPDFYISTDLSHDGEVIALQQPTADDGIYLVLMGDGFSDRQIANGTYANVMNKAMNAFFSEEPYKSFKESFSVLYVNVVSMTEGYEHAGQALGTGFGDDAYVYGHDNKVIEYAKNAVSEDKLDDAVIIVMMNRDYYAGSCYMYYPEGSSNYGHGLSIAYFPTSSDTDTFNGLVSHEAGGHGFAKLADEYAYEYMGAVSDEVVSNRRSQTSSWGWWKNVDFTGDPTQVRWAQFIADSRYAAENIGCYEGAFTYWTGVWRPTENSIMRYNTGGFNAPSRYAIWYRINKLAYGDSWNGTYEDFVEYDAVNRTPAAVARRNARHNCVEKNLPPLAPPVVVGHSWRDAK